MDTKRSVIDTTPLENTALSFFIYASFYPSTYECFIAATSRIFDKNIRLMSDFAFSFSTRVDKDSLAFRYESLRVVVVDCLGRKHRQLIVSRSGRAT